ncbi:MAG: hypothetical protein ACXQTM_06105 [Methanosarcinales archaeon]
MIEIHSNPYTLTTRPDTQESEEPLRERLDLRWVNGCLFNVMAQKRTPQARVEYDAVLWNSRSILFIEYKDSLTAHRRMPAKRAQQVSDFARNIAKTLGFREYNYIIVVNGLESRTVKNGVPVIPLDELERYQPEFQSTQREVEYIDKLIEKHRNTADDELVKELEKLRMMIQERGR